MNAIVIYKSNTGFTRKYAQWIAEALSCEAIPLESAKESDLNRYDAVVFGGWLFAGSIKGLKEIKGRLTAFKGKKAVFAVGSTPSAEDGAQTLNANLNEAELEDIKTFYLRGGLDYVKMGFVHRAMMRMMCLVMKKQKGADSAEYKGISQSFDATDRASIQPLVEYIMK